MWWHVTTEHGSGAELDQHLDKLIRRCDLKRVWNVLKPEHNNCALHEVFLCFSCVFFLLLFVLLLHSSLAFLFWIRCPEFSFFVTIYIFPHGAGSSFRKASVFFGAEHAHRFKNHLEVFHQLTMLLDALWCSFQTSKYHKWKQTSHFAPSPTTETEGWNIEKNG